MLPPLKEVEVLTLDMNETRLEEYIKDEMSASASVDDQIKCAKWMYEFDYKPEGDVVTRTTLKEELEEAGVVLDYKLDTVLSNLVEIDILDKSIRGPQIYIIHERRDTIVNGEDLEELVNEEIDRLIEAVEEADSSEPFVQMDGGIDAFKRLIADTLDTDPESIENELRKNDTMDRLGKLNDAIDALEAEYPETENNDQYGRIVFRHNAYRYFLTGKAVMLYEN